MSLERHPKDSFTMAEPWPMSPATIRAFHGVIRALCPPSPVVPDLEVRIEQQVRRMMRYMQPTIAKAFIVALGVVDLAPVWRFKRMKRLHQLPQAEASDLMSSMQESKIALLGDMVVGLRAAVFGPYYDLEEVGAHIGWEPAPFIRARIAARDRIMAGLVAPKIGPFSSTTAASKMPETRR